MARLKTRWDGASKNKKQRKESKKPLPKNLMADIKINKDDFYKNESL